MKFTALVAIVESEDEEKAIKVSKEAGAGSVVILKGNSMGLKEKTAFLGSVILTENVSALLFILPRKSSMQVLKALRKEFDFENPDTHSLAFTLPLTHVVGLDKEELHKFEKDIETMI